MSNSSTSDSTQSAQSNVSVAPKNHSLDPTAKVFTPSSLKIQVSKPISSNNNDSPAGAEATRQVSDRKPIKPESSPKHRKTPSSLPSTVSNLNTSRQRASKKPEMAQSSPRVKEVCEKKDMRQRNTSFISGPKGFAEGGSSRPVASHRSLIKTIHQIGNQFKITQQKISEDKELGSSAKLEISLPITDPEFPFDLDSLRMSFQLLPSDGYNCFHMTKVLNEDIPRNIAVNIEAALTKRSNSGNGTTLLASLKWLLQNLSQILSQPESSIIKFVSYKADALIQPDPIISPASTTASIVSPVPKNISNGQTLDKAYEALDLNKLSLNQASFLSQRERDIIQMKRRFRSSFTVLSENEHAIKFQIKLAPSDPDYIFKSEVSYFLIDITVPVKFPEVGYPIHAEIATGRPSPKVQGYMLRNAEVKFNEYAQASQFASILHCVNWLDTRIERLLLQAKPKVLDVPSITPPAEVQERRASDYTPPKEEEIGLVKSLVNHEDIHADFTNSADQAMDELNPENIENLDSTPHCGIQLKAVNLSLKNISLVHFSSLEIEVSCDRCKRHLSAPKLKPHQISLFYCPGCHNQLGLQLRPTLFYPSTDSLGYLDILGCCPLLVSRVSITPNCENCDKQNANLSEFKEILLDSQKRENCWQCHTLMQFSLDGIKLVKLAPSSAILENAPKTANLDESVQILGGAVRKEKISSKVGEPLPSFGSCRHYKRSNRWLRFPCCGKAYPCDTCHSDATLGDHDMIFANSMICGFCSHETRYQDHRSDPVCPRCGHKLTGSSRGKAFWEGGKGTRDPSKMSRNDPKKYAGRNKTISRAKKAAS